MRCFDDMDPIDNFGLRDGAMLLVSYGEQLRGVHREVKEVESFQLAFRAPGRP